MQRSRSPILRRITIHLIRCIISYGNLVSKNCDASPCTGRRAQCKCQLSSVQGPGAHSSCTRVNDGLMANNRFINPRRWVLGARCAGISRVTKGKTTSSAALPSVLGVGEETRRIRSVSSAKWRALSAAAPYGFLTSRYLGQKLAERALLKWPRLRRGGGGSGSGDAERKGEDPGPRIAARPRKTCPLPRFMGRRNTRRLTFPRRQLRRRVVYKDRASRLGTRRRPYRNRSASGCWDALSVRAGRRGARA